MESLVLRPPAFNSEQPAALIRLHSTCDELGVERW